MIGDMWMETDSYEVPREAVARRDPLNFGDVTYVPERTCRVVVDHGDHGPEPRFEGDCWTMHWACSECGHPTNQEYAYCPHCGARVERGEA